MKSNNIKRIVYGGLLVAIGVLLPQLFHVFGAQAGQTFLPMHIPVILAGLLVGPWWGALIALLIPVISSLMTGMPAVPMLYFMLFELVAYAVVSGLLAKKLNVYLNLLVTILCGRTVYGLSLVVAVNFLGLHFPFANTAAFFGGIVTGLPGVVIQFVAIPLIFFALKKGGLTIADTKPCHTKAE